MKPLNGKPIIHGNAVQVLCNATVDLLSRRQRPYLFRVTVTGIPPHPYTKIYDISANSDKDAAMIGINRFVNFYSQPLAMILSHPP